MNYSKYFDMIEEVANLLNEARNSAGVKHSDRDAIRVTCIKASEKLSGIVTEMEGEEASIRIKNRN